MQKALAALDPLLWKSNHPHSYFLQAGETYSMASGHLQSWTVSPQPTCNLGVQEPEILYPNIWPRPALLSPSPFLDIAGHPLHS